LFPWSFEHGASRLTRKFELFKHFCELIDTYNPSVHRCRRAATAQAEQPGDTMTSSLKPLENQTAFITAGAAAISIAAAKLLARDGAAVVLMGRRLDALEAAKAQIIASCPHARVEVHGGDACVEADVSAGLRRAYALSNRLDIVISAVGGSGFKPLLLLETEELINDLTLNIVSAFLRLNMPRRSCGMAAALSASHRSRRNCRSPIWHRTTRPRPGSKASFGLRRRSWAVAASA